ncbi:MAG: hypothetical protein FJX78_06150 [Armatimonadetes bacterium]|nr:hypothetical protein [Armatimonadota bacterium]
MGAVTWTAYGTADDVGGTGDFKFDGRLVYVRFFARRFTAADALARATWAEYAHLIPVASASPFKAAAVVAGRTTNFQTLLGVR